MPDGDNTMVGRRVKDCELVEQGTHDTLMELTGTYAELYRLPTSEEFTIGAARQPDEGVLDRQRRLPRTARTLGGSHRLDRNERGGHDATSEVNRVDVLGDIGLDRAVHERRRLHRIRSIDTESGGAGANPTA